MSRNMAGIYADIDAFDPDRFVANLTDDVRFQFGNTDPAIGREAVRQAVAGFFSTIDGLTHHLQASYDVGDFTVAALDVEYVRKDGKHVTVPNADILKFDDKLVKDWQIYIDLAPVFAEETPND